MKKLISLLLILSMLVIGLISCSESEQPESTETETEHTHAFGEWTTEKEPSCLAEGSSYRVCECGEKETQSISKKETHKFTGSNGKCAICNTSAITRIGEFIKANYDQYTSNAYVKSILCSTFSDNSKYKNYYLGFAYQESTGLLVIQLDDSSNHVLSVGIQSSLITGFYDYSYYYSLYQDTINGIFDANNLSTTDSFSYDSYTVGYSEKVFAYFAKEYKEDAATMAKSLFTLFDEYMTKNNIEITSKTLCVN